jgi:hypothetical protein
VQSQLAFWRGMFGGGVLEQGDEQCGAFPIGDTPADDAPAENVDDDVEIEVRPFRVPFLGSVNPSPLGDGMR